MRTTPKDCALSSLWQDTHLPRFDTAPEAHADICIIGGGIAGLTTALELLRRGAKVTVLDDGPIGGGETGRSSAHLASAVDDRYHVLEDKFGADGARLVAESHSAAIDYIEAMTRELSIDCDFRRVDGYLVAPPEHPSPKHRELEREQAAAQRAGLTCELVDAAPYFAANGPALRFAHQAEVHPLRYLRGLADAVASFGGRIHTGVHVVGVDPGTPLTVRLADDRHMLARVVVDATNGAITSHVRLHLRQAAYRTYVIAFAIDPGVLPHALVWDTADPYHYLRIARSPYGGEVLLVGGDDHRTGHGHPEQAMAALEAWARQWIPAIGPVVSRWSGQVVEPVDHLAHIGHSPDLEHVFVVTGDSGNGLTHGTIAGLLLPALMHGEAHPWAALYDPRRSHLHTPANLVREAMSSSAPYTDWLRGGDVRELEDVPRGEGRIIRRGLHLYAVYCDEHGRPHLRYATCPHMRGCVHWNAAEKTWDCPCHGSRFDRYGSVINGPATTDLVGLEAPPVGTLIPIREDEREDRRELRTPLPVMPRRRE